MVSIYKFYSEIEGYQEFNKLTNGANEYLDDYFFSFYKINFRTLHISN